MQKLNLENTPVYVTGVHFKGLKSTNPDFIKQQLTDVVKSKNMRQLLSSVSQTKDTLTNLGIFQEVAVAIDTDSHLKRDDGYCVVFLVKESNKKKYGVSMTTSTERKVQMNGEFSCRNLFGNAERVYLNSSFGSNNSSAYNVDFLKPLYRNANVSMILTGKKEKYEVPWSRFKIANHMLIPGIAFKTKVGFHEILFTNNWRQTYQLGADTPRDILLESGSQFYRGLKHIFFRDTRSGDVFPDSGSHLKITSELCNITPGSKSGLHSQTAEGHVVEPARDSSLQMTWKVSGGIISTLAKGLVAEWNFDTNLAHSLTGHTIPIGDRFFLGGPLNFRGFQLNSLGPRAPLLVPQALLPSGITGMEDKRPSVPVGSPATWLAGFHLYTPLPLFGSDPDSFASLIRVHGFMMAGATASFNGKPNNLRDVRERLFSFPRVTAGLGLVMRLADAIRIELNYCIPLQYLSCDIVKPGLQFGFGITHT